jgi:acetaldehyde dehydrogenase
MNGMARVKVAILGPGNIGTDLLMKLQRSERIEVALMAGVPESQGLGRARELGVEISTGGVEAVIERDDIQLVFDATSAYIHRQNAPKLKVAGKITIDLTPAAIGPYVVPAVNMTEHLTSANINMVTCGGQATIPIVAAVGKVAKVRYAEIVASISSLSAGPGTRQNIDEFTVTTSRAIEQVGGAGAGKAIIVLNPADPPILMRNTVHCLVEGDLDEDAVRRSIAAMVAEVQTYVPGYRLRMPPLVEGNRVTTILEVAGAGDYLPAYSGNLDIMTAAAAGVGERLASHILATKGVAAGGQVHAGR